MKKIIIILIIVILLVCACVQTFCYNINNDIVPSGKLKSVNINASKADSFEITADHNVLMSGETVIHESGISSQIDNINLATNKDKYNSEQYCCEVHQLNVSTNGCCDTPTRFNTDKYPHNTSSNIPCTSTNFKLGEVVADRFNYCCDEPLRFNCCYSPNVGNYSKYFTTKQSNGSAVSSMCDSSCILLGEDTFCRVHNSSMSYVECPRANDAGHEFLHTNSTKGYFHENTKYVTPYDLDWDTGAPLSDFYKVGTIIDDNYSGYKSNCLSSEIDLFPSSMNENYEFVFDFTFSNYNWVPTIPSLVYLNGQAVNVPFTVRYDGVGLNNTQKRIIVSLSFKYAKNLNLKNVKFVFPKACKFKYTVGINDSTQETDYKNYNGLLAYPSYFIANAPADFTPNFFNNNILYKVNCCSSPGIKKYRDSDFYLTDFVDSNGNCGNCGNKYSNLIASEYKVATYDCNNCDFSCSSSLEIYEHRLAHEKTCKVCKNTYKKSSSTINDPCANCSNKFLLVLRCADKNCNTLIQTSYTSSSRYDVLNFRDPKFLNCQSCSNLYNDYNNVRTSCIACEKDYFYVQNYVYVKDVDLTQLVFISATKNLESTLYPTNFSCNITFLRKEEVKRKNYTDAKGNVFTFIKSRMVYSISNMQMDFTNEFLFNFLDRYVDNSLRKISPSQINLSYLVSSTSDYAIKFNNPYHISDVNYQIVIDYNSSVSGLNKAVPFEYVNYHFSGLTFISNGQSYVPTRYDFSSTSPTSFDKGYKTSFSNYADKHRVTYSLTSSPYIPYFQFSSYVKPPVIQDSDVSGIFGIEKIKDPVVWDLVAHANNILYWVLNDCPLISHVVKVLNYCYTFISMFFDKIGLLGQLGIFGSILLGLLVLCFVRKSTA